MGGHKKNKETYRHVLYLGPRHFRGVLSFQYTIFHQFCGLPDNESQWNIIKHPLWQAGHHHPVYERPWLGYGSVCTLWTRYTWCPCGFNMSRSTTYILFTLTSMYGLWFARPTFFYFGDVFNVFREFLRSSEKPFVWGPHFSLSQDVVVASSWFASATTKSWPHSRSHCH